MRAVSLLPLLALGCTAAPMTPAVVEPAGAVAPVAEAAPSPAGPERARTPGVRDPFIAFDDTPLPGADKPLQQFSLARIRVQGVVVAASPRALLITPDGKSHIARVGDSIGTRWGRIEAIRRGEVQVVEESRDALGVHHTERIVLRPS